MPIFPGPGGGGGGSGTGFEDIIVKGTDESVTSSTTLQDDDELVFAASANVSYMVKLDLNLDDGGGMHKFAFTVPSGATMDFATGMALTPNAVSNEAQMWSQGFSGGTTFLAGCIGAGTQAHIIATVTIGGTPGNIQLQWAQNASNPNASIVKRGSAMYVKAIS